MSQYSGNSGNFRGRLKRCMVFNMHIDTEIISPLQFGFIFIWKINILNTLNALLGTAPCENVLSGRCGQRKHSRSLIRVFNVGNRIIRY